MGAHLFKPTFSEHSHGFRPGRRTTDAVKIAQAYGQSGKRVVVDVDLAKFLEWVNHDILIDRHKRCIDDAGVIQLNRVCGIARERAQEKLVTVGRGWWRRGAKLDKRHPLSDVPLA